MLEIGYTVSLNEISIAEKIHTVPPAQWLHSQANERKILLAQAGLMPDNLDYVITIVYVAVV